MKWRRGDWRALGFPQRETTELHGRLSDSVGICISHFQNNDAALLDPLVAAA